MDHQTVGEFLADRLRVLCSPALVDSAAGFAFYK